MAFASLPRFLSRRTLIAAFVVLVLGFVGTSCYSLWRSDQRHAAFEAIREDNGSVYTRLPKNIPRWLEPLAKRLGIRHVQSIRFQGSFSTRTAELLPWLSETIDLSATGTFVNSELACLQAMHRLEGLYLDRAIIPDGSLQSLPVSLIRLSLNQCKLGDEELNHIRRCTRLKLLDISETATSDQGTMGFTELHALEELYLTGTMIGEGTSKRLGNLAQLRILSMNDCNITDTAMFHLRKLERVRYLYLNGTPITDLGLKHIAAMTELEHLQLEGTGVTSTGMVHMKEMQRLQWLNLDNTSVTDEGLVNVKDMLKLEQLYLANTEVTDEGLKHLAGLKSLFFLSLTNTKVTDRGIQVFKSLSKLERLNLDDTDVTPEGVANLRSQLPELEVWY